MAVIITDTCINCAACIDECPVEAIVDEDDNPLGEEIFYVYADKCVECVGHYEVPVCAEACPTEGCIVWYDVQEGMPQQPNRGDKEKPVIED